MLANLTNLGQSLEAGMLVCFGISWPFAIWRTYRTKRTEGKSMVFLWMVLLGYACGIAAKFFRAAGGGQLEWVVALYAMCFVLVACDLCLVIRYRRLGRP
jgi:hypothetical protein